MRHIFAVVSVCVMFCLQVISVNATSRSHRSAYTNTGFLGGQMWANQAYLMPFAGSMALRGHPRCYSIHCVGEVQYLCRALSDAGHATPQTPGRTQTLNFFTIGDDFRLVDLPGYGYAKAPKQVTQQWGQAVTEYVTMCAKVQERARREDGCLYAGVRALMMMEVSC